MEFENIPEELTEKLDGDSDDFAVVQKSELGEAISEYDSDVEDLSTALTDRFEELEAERDDAIEARDEAQEELAEAQEARDDAIEAKEDAVEALGRPYAERLAEVTGFDEDSLMEKFSTEELRDEYEDRAEELAAEKEEADTENLLRSLDPSPKAQDTESEELGGEEEEDSMIEELSSEDQKNLKVLSDQINKYESAGGPWQDAAQSARTQFEELAGVSHDDFQTEKLADVEYDEGSAELK